MCALSSRQPQHENIAEMLYCSIRFSLVQLQYISCKQQTSKNQQSDCP